MCDLCNEGRENFSWYDRNATLHCASGNEQRQTLIFSKKKFEVSYHQLDQAILFKEWYRRCPLKEVSSTRLLRHLKGAPPGLTTLSMALRIWKIAKVRDLIDSQSQQL